MEMIPLTMSSEENSGNGGREATPSAPTPSSNNNNDSTNKNTQSRRSQNNNGDNNAALNSSSNVRSDRDTHNSYINKANADFQGDKPELGVVLAKQYEKVTKKVAFDVFRERLARYIVGAWLRTSRTHGKIFRKQRNQRS